MDYSRARILVATSALADAKLIARLLGDEFDAVDVSVDELRIVEEFEKARPDVLVLAFRTLEESERYYLGLYRKGETVHAHPHRTIILCGFPDMKRTYDLCKKEYFDDYVLFWPAGNDAPRLCMSVIQAVRRLFAQHDDQPSVAEFATQARKLAELDAALRAAVSRGSSQLAGIDASLQTAQQGASEAIAQFSKVLIANESNPIVQIRDDAAFSLAIERLKEDAVAAPMQQVRERAIDPVRAWAGELDTAVEGQSESARRIADLAARVRLQVLVVDDDEFQLRLLDHLLSSMDLVPVVCVDASTALSKLRSFKPDFIMVDLNLPDINGIDLTRRIKAVGPLRDVPLVVMTGASNKHNVIESLRAGAADFVVKPFDRERLHAKLKRFLPV